VQFPRTHRSSVDERGRPRNIGWEIVSKLIDYINSLPDDRIKTIYGAKMTKLITNANGDVVGVKYLDFLSKNEISVYADAIILATGG
jgi:succinate dehydrogenase/fumarate reductase flavoprotein subunit